MGRFFTLCLFVCWLVGWLVDWLVFIVSSLLPNIIVGSYGGPPRLPACPLGSFIIFDILQRRICHVTSGFINVNSGMHGVTSAYETQTPFHHRFCIQTYAKGREFCFGFRAHFSSIFFFFFYFLLFHMSFESIAFFYISTVNPRSLALETIPFRLKSENGSLTILAWIFSNGSVVNVV